MKHILIIENNNLPIDILVDGYKVTRRTVYPDDRELSESEFNYDDFITRALSEEAFKDKIKYDCVILPYTMSVQDYMEYTGVVIGLHIRLTKEWRNMKTPILFLGPDKIEEVARFSKYGSFLFSSYVFHSSERDSDNFKSELNRILMLPEMTNEQYSRIIRGIVIPPPEFYDTHHSVANKWAAGRWCEMLGIKPENSNFKNLLYFKHLAVKRPRKPAETFKGCPIDSEDGFEKAYFCFIDDQYRDWSYIIKAIFKNSGNPPVKVFDGFSKDDIDTQDKLIDRIKCWINDQEEQALTQRRIPIYILDLRLCEADRNYTAGDHEYSGIKILKYIKGEGVKTDYSSQNYVTECSKRNKGNQVLFFTASNKIWNAQKALKCGADEYVIKESPEHTTDSSDSSQLFGQFKQSIKNCYQRRYQKIWLGKCAEIKVKFHDDSKLIRNIELFEALVVINKDEVIDHMILLLIKIIEHYCYSKNYTIDGSGYLISNGSNDKLQVFFENNHTALFAYKKINGKLNEIVFQKTKMGDCDNIALVFPDSEKDDTRRISVMITKGIPEKSINDWYKLKDYRNTTIAHILDSDYHNASLKDVTFLFEDIVCKLMEIN